MHVCASGDKKSWGNVENLIQMELVYPNSQRWFKPNQCCFFNLVHGVELQ